MRSSDGDFTEKCISQPVLERQELSITISRVMHNSDPLTPSPLMPINSDVTNIKDGSRSNQVMIWKEVEKTIQVVHRLALRSCRRACQLFCCPIDTPLCEKVACCPGRNCQSTDDKTTQAMATRSPPSTILIVNISNSTLIDCVIGNDAYPHIVAEKQPLMQEAKLHMYDQARCSCSRGQQKAAETSPPPPSPPPSPLPSAEPSGINIYSSQLNCVIIGDNNYMHADQTYSTETEDM